MTKHATTKKKRTSFALSDEAKRLLKLLKEKKGISEASVIELLVREEAKREKIE